MNDTSRCFAAPDLGPSSVPPRGQLPLRLLRLGDDDAAEQRVRSTDAPATEEAVPADGPDAARVRGVRERAPKPRRVKVWESAGGYVRRAEWPSGPKFYAYGCGRAKPYYGAFPKLEEAVAAIVSAGIVETPRQRRDRIVARAIETLRQIPASVRRELLDDVDDPIPGFFARFGVRTTVREMETIYAVPSGTLVAAERSGIEAIGASHEARDAYENAMSREPTWWDILGGMADA